MTAADALRRARPGSVIAIGNDDGDTLPAFVYVPQQLNRDAAPLVSVHGYTRNALTHAMRFRDMADVHGVPCIAPLFSRQRFVAYQTLAPGRSNQSPAAAMCELVDAVTTALQLPQQPARWFGFSGGGQFLHRFALRHPERVASAVLAAPGWYTFPDPTSPWPRGLRDSPWDADRTLMAYMRIPMLVLVGDRDTEPDGTLNRKKSVVAQQGVHRLERAGRWVKAMHEAARALALPSRVSLNVLPGVGHSFDSAMVRHDMDRRAAAHLFLTSASPDCTPLRQLESV